MNGDKLETASFSSVDDGSLTNEFQWRPLLIENRIDVVDHPPEYDYLFNSRSKIPENTIFFHIPKKAKDVFGSIVLAIGALILIWLLLIIISCADNPVSLILAIGLALSVIFGIPNLFKYCWHVIVSPMNSDRNGIYISPAELFVRDYVSADYVSVSKSSIIKIEQIISKDNCQLKIIWKTCENKIYYDSIDTYLPEGEFKKIYDYLCRWLAKA